MRVALVKEGTNEVVFWTSQVAATENSISFIYKDSLITINKQETNWHYQFKNYDSVEIRIAEGN